MPSWQLKQVPSTSAWSTWIAGSQAVVRWQASQTVLVWIWLLFLPVAAVPSWQLAQLPVTLLWSKVAGSHAVVPWQSSQVAALGMWFALLPMAVAPS